MKLKTKIFNLELTPSKIECLEEELFNLHLWDNDRDSALNKHKIQIGDFPHLEDLLSILQQVKGNEGVSPGLRKIKNKRKEDKK